MSRWILSIDFGTSFTAASTRESGRSPELVEIDGPFGPQGRMPSIVVALEDGELLVGWAGETQAQTTPERAERTPKRRLGEAEPLLLGDRAVPVEDAVAAVLRSVLQEAKRRRGGTEPAEVRLTHPARWARRRLDALRDAAGRAGIRQPLLLSEPAAAAVHFSERLSPGDVVAVYDLGGGTFDTAVLRRTETGEFEQVGPPGGKDGLGGEAFDERLANFVETELGPDAAQLQGNQRARAEFRRNVRSAKEALSQASAVDVPLPAALERQSVRVTRDDFERLIRLDVEESVEILGRTLADAGIRPESLNGIFLAGGSTRIPLVPRLVEERLGRYDTYDEPKAVVALGASRYETTPVRAEPQKAEPRKQRTPPPPPPPPRLPRHWRRPALLAGGSALAVLVLAVLVFALVRSGDSSTGTTTTTAATTGFPSTADERQLSGLLPDSTSNCTDSSTPGAIAAAECEVENGLTGTFSLFPDDDTMNSQFDVKAGGEPGVSEQCPPDGRGEWDGGQLACYLVGTTAHVAWTDETYSILSDVWAEGEQDFEVLINSFENLQFG